MAEPALAAVQALIRWDAATHADRELAEREELRFPPAVRMAALTGTPDAIAELLGSVSLPQHADLLGPVPAENPEPAGAGTGQIVRYLVRVPWPEGTALAVALRGGQAERSARKSQGQVRLHLDPAELI
jgi:primosomal protein N' (replication factor Y)